MALVFFRSRIGIICGILRTSFMVLLYHDYVTQSTKQTIKKVPASRHVRMDGTHTGKLSAESVRGRKAECAVQRSILSPGGHQGEGISVLRSRQKWVPPGAWRFCATLTCPLGSV